MFHLFGKKTSDPESRLAECRKKQDWAGLAKIYYQLGVEAMEAGNLNRAQLWLTRADTIYSSDDDIYKKVGEKLMDDCSDRIGQLEEEHFFYQDIPAKISEMAEELPDVRVRVWGLLSLARLVKPGERLALLPGCEALGKLGRAVDIALKSFQEPPTEKEFNELKNLCGELYELGDEPDFWGAGSEIALQGRAPFQVFDLNGLMGAHLEIEAYLDAQLKMVCALGQGEEAGPAETGIIAQPLLPDYYVRTQEGSPEENPGIKAELERIWSDYAFVSSDMTWELVSRRVAEYKELDILA
ncbi:MAG: hypothetical protein HFH85_05880 [Lachnospiraceae bacterium]|jgi:hypothetical protein|nr:hypothetical protein [Lachnospiraceae bacterium]